MARSTKTSIHERLTYAELVISNSLMNPNIQGLVAAYGYPAEVLYSGQRLLTTARQAVETQVATVAASSLATDNARQAKQAAHTSYQRLVKLVRAIYPAESPQLKALGVTGREPKQAAAFIESATIVFNNAMRIREIGAMLEKFGYTPGRLATERASILEYKAAFLAQARMRTEAKTATVTQKAAMNALRRWMAQYLKIARIALHHRPDLLKDFDIAARPATLAVPAEPASLTFE